jgi:hypothetical protein
MNSRAGVVYRPAEGAGSLTAANACGSENALQLTSACGSSKEAVTARTCYGLLAFGRDAARHNFESESLKKSYTEFAVNDFNDGD